MPITLFPPQGLQKQICELATELTRQASCWCTAHKNLQSQIDALMKENQEIREEMRALKQQGMEVAKPPEGSSSAAEAANTQVQQIFCITEIAARRHAASAGYPVWAYCVSLNHNVTEVTVSVDWAFLGALGTEHDPTVSLGHSQARMGHSQAQMGQLHTWPGLLRTPGSYFTLPDVLDPVINSSEAQGEVGLRSNLTV